MKNRKRVIVAFMLVAVMLLGVGYAAITDVLDIQGTAEVTTGNSQSALDQDVYFSGVKDPSDSTFKNNVTYTIGTEVQYTAQINSDNNDKASFTVSGLKKKGDAIQITYNITNNGAADLTATVTPLLLQNSNSTYFDVTSDWNSLPQDIAPSASKTITITITLKETPTVAVSTSINIELTAVADENDPTP